MGHIVAIKGDSLTFLEACKKETPPREVTWVDVSFDQQCTLDKPDVLRTEGLHIQGEPDLGMRIVREVSPDKAAGASRQVLIVNGSAKDLNRVKEGQGLVISTTDGQQVVLQFDDQQAQALKEQKRVSGRQKGQEARFSVELNDQQARVLKNLDEQQQLKGISGSCSPNSDAFVIRRFESYSGHSFNLWVRPSESPVQFYPTQDAAETHCPQKQYTPTFLTSFCNKTTLITDDVELLWDDLLRMKLPDGSQHVEPRQHVTQLRKVFRCVPSAPSQAAPPSEGQPTQRQ